MNVKLWLALCVALLAVIFAAQNYQVVELRFLFWKVETSRALMIVSLFFGGVLVGWLLSGLRRLTHSSN